MLKKDQSLLKNIELHAFRFQLFQMARYTVETPVKFLLTDQIALYVCICTLA